MRRLALALTALVSFATAPALAEPQPLERYRAVFGPKVQLTWNVTKTAPMALFGLSKATLGASPGERAEHFAREHARFLGLVGSDVRAVASHQVILAGQTFDGVRLERVWHGMPVEGQGLQVRLDAKGRVTSVTSSVGDLLIEPPVNPIDGDRAVALVRAGYDVAAVGHPTHVVVARGTAGRVAWRVPVALIPLQAHFFVWVDAADGRILGEAPVSPDQPVRELPHREDVP